MRKLKSKISEWLSRKEVCNKEKKMEILRAEAARVINIREITEASDGSVKYGLFLSDNLVAIYDKPTEEMLLRMIDLRKMYINLWSPDKVYLL